jgi:hypothetical protein
VLLHQPVLLHQHQRQVRQAVLLDQGDGRDFLRHRGARERRHGDETEAEFAPAHASLP